MPRPTRLALSLAVSALLLGSAYADPAAPQAASDLAAQRSVGTNAKLDNHLLGIKRRAQSSAASTPLPSSSRAASAASATVTAPSTTESYVAVDVIAKGDPQALKAKLEKLGFKTSAVYEDDIGGQLPVSQIDNAAALDEVLRIGAPQKYTRAGSVDDQGDFVQHSRLVRASVATAASAQSSRPRYVDGSGLTIGVLSNSFDCSGQHNRQHANDSQWSHETDQDDDVTSGDLPKGVRVVQEGICFDEKGNPVSDDEGRAMAQIIHDVAPGAKVAFYSPDTMADFAQGIQTLALPTNKTDAKGRQGAGAQIIVDDIGFYAEPLYQEGIIGQAIDEVSEKRGVAYFTAAGNASYNYADRGDLRGAYDNNAAAFLSAAVTKPKGATVLPANLNERLLNFDASGASTIKRLPVVVGRSATDDVLVTFLLFWDQPMTGKGANSSLELCLTDADGNPLSNTSLVNTSDSSNLLCSGPSGIGQPAQAILQIKNPAGSALANGYLQVGLAEQGKGKLPGRVHILIANGGQAAITSYGTDAGSIYGHPLSPYAAAIGAADYFQTPDCSPQLVTAGLEPYSSFGYTPILFDPKGKPVAAPAIPRKPDFVAPDGASTTFFGGKGDADAALSTNASCRPTTHHFYGTSAAAPHAAAAAALLKQALPAATRADLLDAIEQSTQEMYVPGFDYRTGYGFLQTDAAYVKLKALLDSRQEKATSHAIDGLPLPDSAP